MGAAESRRRPLNLAFSDDERMYGVLLGEDLLFCGSNEHRCSDSGWTYLVSYGWSVHAQRWTAVVVGRSTDPDRPERRAVRHAATIDAAYEESAQLLDGWAEAATATFVRAMAPVEGPIRVDGRDGALHRLRRRDRD